MAECGDPRKAKPGYDEHALKVVWRDRECKSFFQHIPGFDPKEHWQIYEMQRLEQDRREFEQRLAKRDEDVHTALVNSQQAFQLERERTQQAFQLERLNAKKHKKQQPI